jgi:YVTN family beta-propeller protein
MKKLMSLLLVLATAGWAAAQQAPIAQQDVSTSSHDRVYSADQTSNTVSVIDPANNRLLGVIRLGDPVPASLSPLYRGALMVHGLGYSPDGKTLAVVSVGSNSVTLIDTSTNSSKGVVYVGRAPHEAFFTPDGRELWVTVRGEDYVSVIDPVAMGETLCVQLANGSGMTMFSPDGKYGFVCSSFTPELAVVEVQSHSKVEIRVNCAVSTEVRRRLAEQWNAS